MKTIPNINPVSDALKHFALAVTVGVGLGTGTALAAPPANDNFADAIALVGDSGTQTGTTTVDATFEVGEPECFYPEATNTVWFKWTCTTSGSFSISTLGSTNTTAGEWDAVGGIYTGATLATLTPLPGSPQDGGAQEVLIAAVTAGTTYYIQLAGDNGSPPQDATNILLNWTFTPPAVVDVAGYITSPNSVVGLGSTANMTADTTFGWMTYGCAIPVITNGFLFSMDSGGGNYYNYTGDISGAGGLVVGAGGIGILHLGGSVGNTYSGNTVVNNGPVSLEKSSGNALCGAITVQGSPSGSFPGMGSVVWTAANQINDGSNVTLNGTSWLNLAGFTDTINELYLVTGSAVQTGAGGVLKVTKLFINGVQQPDVAYIAGDGYVLGSGYIEVGASGPPVINNPPATPVNPIPAIASTTANPAFLTKLEWDDSALASSYDVYLWLATDPDLVPGVDPPTATVSLSEYPLPAQLISLTDYKWKVVAKNGVGNTPGALWTFTTMDRRDISGEIAIDPVVGTGNTGRLIGTTTTGWWSGGYTVPLNLNENTLRIASGGGNAMNAAGEIFGNGVVQVYAGGVGILYITGSVGNTYTGTTLVNSGPVSLGKSSGNALSGTITVQTLPSTGFPGMGNVIWTANDQISDTSDVSVITSGAYLNLAGFSDTIASLNLAAGTSVETGSGGVLTVSALTVDTVIKGPGTYTSADGFVTGTGSVVVAGASNDYGTWATANAGGQAANLDYDNDGMSNGVEYFMGATGSSFTPNPPVVDTAGVLTVTWPRDPDAVASFMVQVSDDLSTWTDIVPPNGSINTSIPTQVTYTLPSGAAKKFCRLVVTP